MTKKNIYVPIIGEGHSTTPTRESVGIDVSMTWAARKTPAEFGVGQAIFSDYPGVVCDSDGTKWYNNGVDITNKTPTIASLVTLSEANTGQQNHALMQAGLNAGACIITQPGAYKYSGTLSIPSNSYFYTAPGVDLLRENVAGLGSAVPFSKNVNWDSAVWPVTGQVAAVALGSGALAKIYAVTVTLAAHDITAIGQYILLKNDTTELYNGIHRVHAFDVTTVTFLFQYTSGGMPASTTNAVKPLTIALADHNIVIEINGWLSGEIQNNIYNSVDNNNSHLCIFNKVNNLKIKAFNGGNALKYAISGANLWNAVIENFYFINQSDGIHFSGPINNTTITKGRGNTQDAFIAYTAIDYERYYLNDSQDAGIDGYYIADIKPTHCGNGIFIGTDGIQKAKNIYIDGVKCQSVASGSGFIYIGGSDTSSGWTFTANSNATDTLTNVVWSSTYYTNLRNFNIYGTGIADGTFIISHDTVANTIKLSQAATNTATGQTWKVTSIGTVESLTIKNLTPPKNAAYSPGVSILACVIEKLLIDNPQDPTENVIDTIITGTIGSGNNTLNVTATAGMGYQLGMEVSGPGLVAGTFIRSVNANSLTLSDNAVAAITAGPFRVHKRLGTNATLVNVMQYGRVNSIKIINADLLYDGTASGHTRNLIKGGGTSHFIGDVVFENVKARAIGGQSVSLINTSIGLRSFKASNVGLQNNVRFFEITGGGGIPINIADIDLYNAHSLFGAIPSGSTIKINGLVIRGSLLSGVCINLYTTPITVNFDLNGIRNETATALIVYTGGNTHNLLGSDGSANIDATKFTAFSKGAMFYNNAAGYSAGIGVYIAGTATTALLVA